MGNDMTIGQVIEARRKTETNIMMVLQRLHEETGMVINSVGLRVYRHDHLGSERGDWCLIGVDIDIRLDA